MNQKIVIFGASGGGIKVAQTLESFDIDFYCFVDNNKNKWETLEKNTGKRICSPEILRKADFQIIIASEHQAEIEKQLEEMGQLRHLVLKEDLILPYVEKMFREFQKENISKTNSAKNNKVIIDLAEGVQLGGIETWTYTVTTELQKLGVDVEVFAKKTDMEPPEDIHSCFTYFDIEYCDFKKNVYTLANEIAKRSPCTVIINKHTQILYAAYVAKKLYMPDEIKIISMIHNDLITLYRRQQKIDFMVDAVCCVSGRIQKTLIDKFHIPKEKVFYKESPVYLTEETDFSRDYTINPIEPIRLGYAARLTKFQKRADLFPKLIKELECRKCNYYLSIAGDGAYRQCLEEFVKQHHMENRVKVLGHLTHREIADFWLKQDIFISFSDFEGVGLSMLEAMSQGVIPIETNVAGSEELIEHGKNGYIVPLEDVNEMADYILWLDKNRKYLPGMGKNARKMVVEKCSPEDYGKYISECCSILL